MRVYEFAKKLGISSKEIISFLEEKGVKLSSHMAVIPEDAMPLLNSAFGDNKDHIKPSATEKKIEPSTTKKIEKQAEDSLLTKPTPTKDAKLAPMPHVIPSEKPAVESKKDEKEKILQKAIVLAPAILSDLALQLEKPTSELIITLLKWGILSSKNHLLSVEVIERLAHHYQVPISKPIEKIQPESATRRLHESTAQSTTAKERLPVVVIMGHVDHGKTTLLDFIRKTRVAAKEKGGITQHLGAYEANTSQGNIIFIDTPGHEAFSKIRVRGAKVADLVVLVVAADDGVMPQTVEALKQAQAMSAPIIVAINKIDKAEKARIDVVKRDLATQYNLLPEEWGGQTIYVPISAKTGQGIDQLLEMIVLQSQLMELKAEHEGFAKGFVLESKLEKGRGPVATIITQQGILRIGDFFVAGGSSGKISSMIDSFGRRVLTVVPSQPVQIAGFNELPNAGDYFEVVAKDTYLKSKTLSSSSRVSSVPQLSSDSKNTIKILIKTDTNSSKEAIIDSIAKFSKKNEKHFKILHASIGNVNESDVMLAYDTAARIITLHVKIESNAAVLAQKLGVSVESFDIIYKFLDHLQEIIVSLTPVKMVRTKVGEGVVRKVFDIKDLGVIAGCYLKQGIFSREGFVIGWRGNKKIAEGKISSLQRDKNAVKEVHTGFEFAFMIDGHKDWQIDDRIECFLDRAEQIKK